VLNPLFWLQAISLAFSQIWANKSRAFLTALGIIVGVASTTAVIAALTGLKSKVLAEFESVGASKFFVFPDRPDNAPRNMYPWEKILLKPAEVRAIRESRAVGALGANTAEIPIARLIAEVTSPDGTTLAILERVAPRETSSGGSR
jgi:hypothetical protein